MRTQVRSGVVVGVVISCLAGCGLFTDEDAPVPPVVEDTEARKATVMAIARVQAAAANVDLALTDTSAAFAAPTPLDLDDPQLVRLQLTLAGADATGRSPLADLDLSSMTIEEAITMMFMLIAEDARQDLHEMLEEMNATNLQRSGLREAITSLQREESLLIQALREEYDHRTKLAPVEAGEATVDAVAWRVTDHYDLAIAPAHGLVFETLPAPHDVSIAFDCGTTQNVTAVRLAVTDVRNDATFRDLLGTTAATATFTVDEPTAASVAPSLPKAGQSLTTSVMCSLVINRMRAPAMKLAVDPARASALRGLVAVGKKQIGEARAEIVALVQAQTPGLTFDNAGALMHALDRIDNAASHLELDLDDAAGISEELWQRHETLGELGEESARRLALHQERRGQVFATLAAIVKAVAMTQSGIIANLK